MNQTLASAKSSIEGALANHFGRRFCVLTNRGTTALTAALHALDRPGAGVVFPGAMCSIPVFAATFAGWRPVFADVNLEDGNFDLADLARVMEEEKGRVGAVAPVHMFGEPDNMEALKALCDQQGAALLEDGALSMGATYQGRPAGAWGRLSCLSFVRKMIPLEMGGAVLTDEPDLARRAQSYVDALPPPPTGQRQLVHAAMKAFHSLTGFVAAGDWIRIELLRPFEEEFRRLLLSSTEEGDWQAEVVLRELATLDDVVAARRKRAEVYDMALHHPRFRPLARRGGCLFAYPARLVDSQAEDFLQWSSEQGHHFRRIAYPAVHRAFGSTRTLPNAERLEKELWGLPVDDNQALSSFWELARDMQNSLDEYFKEARPVSDWRGRLELRMGSQA